MNYFNSELADISLQIIKPCKELEPYIHSYWIARKQHLTKNISNKILSDGNSGIVFNFSYAFITKINSKEFICKEKVTYCGPTKHPLFMDFDNSIDVIGIRFKAGAAYKFFNQEISTFKDIVIEVENSDEFKIDNLYEELIKINEVNEKISHIEKFLLNKIQNSPKQNSSWIFDFRDNIIKNNGDVNIEELCKYFNISTRLCARKFNQEVGISAKLFARLTRIVNAKNTLSSLNINSLTSIAYDNGFFDQAHFTNDFKSFMYETPKDYFTKKYNDATKLNFKKFIK